MGAQRLPVHGGQKGFSLLASQKDQIETDLGSRSTEALIGAVLADLANEGLQERAAALAATTFEQLSCCAATTGAPLADCRRRDPCQWCGHGSLKAPRH